MPVAQVGAPVAGRGTRRLQRVAARVSDFRVRLALVVVLGVAVRIWWVLAFGADQEVAGDQLFYHLQGRALAEGEGFVNPYAWNDPVTPLDIPTAAHPPGYSTFLGGVSVLGATSHLQHRLASTLLGAGVVLVAGLVGRRVAGERAGIAAAVVAALYPNLWINDGLLAAESLYALTIGLVLLAAYRLWDDPRPLSSALLGGAVGLAALTRAEAAMLFVLLVLPLALRLARPLRTRVELLAVAAVVGAVVLAPWVARNLTTWDEPVVLSSGAGFVLEAANCDATYSGRFLGYWSQECYRDDTWPVQPDVTPDMSPAEVEEARQRARVESARAEPQVEQRKREVGLEYMREHADEVPQVVLARVARMWDVWRPGQSVEFNDFFERRGRWSTIAGMAVYYTLWPLAVIGAVTLWRRGTTIIPFVALALGVTITAALSFGITRYRVGADVGLAVLAGVGAVAAWGWWRARGAGASSLPGSREPGDASGDLVGR